ncbi:MAG: hypothetical protein ACTSRS_09910 [Candidatus Helarchaeota archaeon]
MSDLEDLIKVLIDYTRTINWGNYYAKWSKDHARDQSLLVHSINQASLMQFLFEKIIDPTIFSKQDKMIALIASYFSDTGKSLEQFQHAAISRVREEEAYNHITAASLELVDQHLEFLKESFQRRFALFKDESDWIKIKNEIKRNVCFHQRVKAPDLKDSCAKYGGTSNVSSLIDYIDDITSIKSVEKAYKFAIKKDGVEHFLGNADFTYHKLSQIRGILTVLLNETLIDIHKKYGYEPFLYYSDGVLYIAPQKKKIATDFSEITVQLNTKIQELITTRHFQVKLSDIVFGPITQRIVLYPPLLTKEIVQLKIENELKKSATSKNFEKNIELFNNRIISERESADLKGTPYLKYIEQLGKQFKTTPEVLIEGYSMYQSVMTYFYAIVKKYIEWGERKASNYRMIAEKMLQKYFPFAHFTLLDSGSANTASKLNKFIMLINFWKKNSTELLITSLEGREQFENRLNGYLDELYEDVKEYKENLIPVEMVEDLLLDISHSALGSLISSYKKVSQELESAYLQGKERAENRSCFFCGLKYFNDAIKERIGEGPRKFSNKLIGGKRIGSRHQAGICSLCETEATLRKIIMGAVPAEIILVAPEINMSPEIRRYWANEIKTFMEFRRGSVSLLNDKTLSKAIEEIALMHEDTVQDINAKWISKNLIFSKTKINRIKKELQEDYDSIDEFNEYFDSNFNNFEELVKAILTQQWWHPDLEAIIPPASEIEYLYETPNYFFIFLKFELKDKDAPESAGYLKRLFFGILLSILFNARVKFITNLNPILFSEIAGLVSVPETSLIDIIDKCINPDKIITFTNRFEILKRLSSLIGLQNHLKNTENDFLLKYMKFSRGFILNKLRAKQVKISNDLIKILNNFPKYEVEI